MKGNLKIMVSSTSKIRNRTVNVKNRNEKLIRILWLGSNPHSKVVIFSLRLACFFNFNKYDSKLRIKIIIIIICNMRKEIKIF